MASDRIHSGMWGRTLDGFYTLLEENSSERFGYNPSGYEGLKKESLNVFCRGHDEVNMTVEGHATRWRAQKEKLNNG